ncbi:hypothetical protein FRC18_007189 [Serendipita sp. 400]|nr:hypothetical protein FRC18_007189 [Serendipita sp. 400]
MSQSDALHQVESSFQKPQLNNLCPPLSGNQHKSSGSQGPGKQIDEPAPFEGAPTATTNTSYGSDPALLDSSPVSNMSRSRMIKKSSGRSPNLPVCSAISDKVIAPNATLESSHIQVATPRPKDRISKSSMSTASLRDARRGGRTSLLGKRRHFTEEGDTPVDLMILKRSRLHDWGLLPDETSVRYEYEKWYPPVSDGHVAVWNRSDNYNQVDTSILPFHWAGKESDPLVDIVRQSLTLEYYEVAHSALREYKEHIRCGSKSEILSTSRDAMKSAWSKWAQTRGEPPTLLWLYHTGHGLDCRGRRAIASAFNFCSMADHQTTISSQPSVSTPAPEQPPPATSDSDNLAMRVQKWIEEPQTRQSSAGMKETIRGQSEQTSDDNPPEAQRPQGASSESKSIIAESEEEVDEASTTLGTTPARRIGRSKGRLPGWAGSCLYSDSSKALLKHIGEQVSRLKQKPRVLGYAEETTLLGMMFDGEGNELRGTDRSGNEVTNARGTEAYHSLPTDQKMVILDEQKEVTALAKALKVTMGDKDFAVVCHLSFSISDGKQFVYERRPCLCIFASKDDVLRHIKEQHFGLLRRRAAKKA